MTPRVSKTRARATRLSRGLITAPLRFAESNAHRVVREDNPPAPVSLGYLVCGMLKSAPARIPEGQRDVIVFSRV